ncbi:LysR family transcriptional regulator [Burkholderia sp. AU33423]|uniref:LysR family transcriptional regulator n=1 Tax=Burkholderia contaminans TaxID=488447 RepID=A0A6P3B0U9_9BURK|nr:MULTISPECIES: LysR substrate-binding domain-containing protein [Burkholderia]OXI77748.1 LysR family transcriptional regulator [Burkholderia sp. AU33423]OXJ25600.1 LysR family transcriptional regulator [Burkholderia sp. HI2714]VWD49425.1 LysR family transcriptional regulator [Burkholderia contaminans]
MKRLPSLNALQVFDIVARHGSFTRAAEHLCLTQGAVSRQILALESFYQFALFKRTPKGLTLTAEGELLLPTVRESFARIEEVSMRLSRRRTELALKVPTCMMQWMLPRIMRFQAEHPELQVQITTTWDHQVDFRMEPFDAAVIYAAGAGPDTHAIPLFEERLTPVCAPSLPARQPLASLDDLAGHTLLHPTRDHRDWKRWLDHAGAPHVDSTRGLSFETLDLATHAAIDGYGVAIGDRTLADESVAAHRLVMPFDISLPTGMGYYFVYPDGAEQQQKIQLFGGWIADERKGASSGGTPARPDTSAPHAT